MTKLMMVLVIAITACGVDQPTNSDRQGDELGAGRKHVPHQTVTTADELEPCEQTADCSIGICDQDAQVCIGDDSWRAAEEEAHAEANSLRERMQAEHVQKL